MTYAPQATSAHAIEHIFEAWDAALGAKDLDATMALYQPDATLESPLVRQLLAVDDGIVRGRDSLRAFVEKVFALEPPERQRFRVGFLSDGSRVTWEYPRQAGAGEQMDIVEVMEIRDGLIQNHRVYWGWYSVRLYETLKSRGD
ncbi:MAG TPA: nuclear transport factor 2 family protein [Solirubrobacteraceae bacterium]|nr:nuclear transport factor 2 family protein [Solirubrobacteraceae bacterium]